MTDAVVVEDIHARLGKLLTPFPPSAIGKLPKGGVMLDFVGHAAVTKRLLEVDPEWSWEPMALDEDGLPKYDKSGGFWIKLTVCGVTRLGYGDGPDPKQRIGDALRNAAMRFGVALDLWSKDDISDTFVQPHVEAPQAPVDPLREDVRAWVADATDETKKAWTAWWKEQGYAWSSLTDEKRDAIRKWWSELPIAETWSEEPF